MEIKNTITFKKYEDYCKNRGISFSYIDNFNSYDDTTLFCPAGMQKYKDKYLSKDIGTEANIQACLRTQDIEELGDGRHLLYFNMIGLFSFRQMTMQEAVDFWMEFLEYINIKIDKVTIHPDKESWRELYSKYPTIKIELDKDCIWTDGNIGGYCTEFYYKEVEIGNIVNTLGTCIDVGFGLERIESILNNKSSDEKGYCIDTYNKIVKLGILPYKSGQGYVLRKLIRKMYSLNWIVKDEIFSKEINRLINLNRNYLKLKQKYPNKPKSWFYETHGIDLDLIT